MNIRPVGLFAAALTLAASALSGAFAQQPSAPEGKAAIAPPPPGVDGNALFRQRCATCHDPAVDRAPSRAALAARAPEQIVDALTRGAMQPMAIGLTPAEIRAIATGVTGTRIAVGGGRDPNLQPPDNKCAHSGPIRMTPTSWNGWGFDLTGTRFQPRPGLAAADIPRLKVKWTFAYAGGRYGQPTVIGDRLFITSSGGQVYSLDARTGCVHWRFNLQNGSRHTPIIERRPGASPSGWVAYFAELQGGHLYAVDAETGRELWKLPVHDHPRGVLTGAPVIYKDRLYMTTSSWEEITGGAAMYECCTFRGSVVAVDLKTHKEVWRTYMMPEPKPTRRSADGHQNHGPAGAAMWMQPTVDVKRNALYVTTGDSYTEIPTDKTDAIVALDLDTGAIRWANQTTANDNYLSCGAREPRPANCPLGVQGPDFDFGSSAILKTLPGGRDILLAGQKSSEVFGLNPDTGAILWRNKLGTGGALGGVEWGMAADNAALYVANADGGRATSGLSAIDMATGRTIWTTPAPQDAACGEGVARCSHTQSAAVSVIPGAVFSGTTDGHFRAYSTTDGKILWDFQTAATFNTLNGGPQKGSNIDGAGPVIVDGMVYTMSGYSGAVGGGNPINVLLAFSVDGK